ncbi:DgyrCDS12500 [Dimorphilus gyrociliatus]|uniref:Glutathione S-transferase kappa n=1 Tax=Dimorphilus gyrociliatus TaxID=2664684 RepID=A0A7I8W7I1_9ANNE|nr:DgyrCDS12500 [Dimorphilus gyrociliatus]
MARRFEIFYDVVSPYSFIGFEMACRLRDTWKINLLLKPFFLGGVMKSSGNTPPAIQCQTKGIYMMKDLENLSRHYNVPVKIDHENFAKVAFEKTTLKPMRYLTAIDMAYPQFTEELSRQFWISFFCKIQDITEPDVIRETSTRAGLNKEQVEKAFEDATSSETKERLTSLTKEAVELGAFGAPWFVIHGKDGKQHTVFGSDRWGVIADILDEEYPGPMRKLSKT